MVALTGYAKELAHDDSDKGHPALADRPDEPGAGAFNALLLRFEPDHESRFIREGDQWKIKGIAELKEANDFVATRHVSGPAEMQR